MNICPGTRLSFNGKLMTSITIVHHPGYIIVVTFAAVVKDVKGNTGREIRLYNTWKAYLRDPRRLPYSTHRQKQGRAITLPFLNVCAW